MRNTLAILAVLAAAGASANAAIITHGPTNFGPFTSGAAGSFSVPQFDDLGGSLTLQSVQLIVTGNSAGGSNSVQNTSANPGLITSLSIGSNITVSGPAALVVLTNPTQTATNVNLTAFVGPALNFTGTDAFVLTGTTSTDTQSTTLNAPPSNLAAYIGGGNVGFNFTSGLDTSNVLNFTSLAVTSPTQFDFTATVIYTYIPAPGSAALLGLGGLLAARRRRN